MIEFEKWFHTNLDSLNEDTQGLFEDSIKCFKYDIDRPAYLSAYQGMLCHLRDVMRKSKRPESFEDGEWQDKLKKISKNSTWDNAIFDCIKQKPNSGKKSAVFSMPEELRGEFDYWRNLRNACAHYKEHELTKAHVQTLYTFIQEHLLSITVEGGMRTLLAEFTDYCDPAKTSETEPVKSLVDKISLMVSPNEMNTFFTELLNIYSHSRYRDEWLLIDSLMTDSKVKCYFETYVKETKPLRTRMIYHKPEYALILLSTEKEFHELWYEITNSPNERNIDVFICLLEAKKVDDIKVANARLCDSLYQMGATFIFTKKRGEVLMQNGYYDIFINKYFNPKFTKDNYNINNMNNDFYMTHIIYYGITDDIARNIISIFECYYHPYRLLNRLNDLFIDRKDMATEFRKKSEELNLKIPSCLKIE